jgi:hypothetical protein
MMRRGWLVVLLACGCSAGVSDSGSGLAFGGMPGGASKDEDADEDEEDESTSSVDDDDDGLTSGVGSLDTGGTTGPDGLPPTPDTSGPPPDPTTGPAPPQTSGPPDPSDGSTSGLPEIESTTSSPSPETSFGDTSTSGGGGPGGGGFGDACEDNADCASQVCVNAGFFLYCSDLCTTEADCPPGWLCVETTTEGVNVCY